MQLKRNFQLLATYNQWMNEKIYTLVEVLDEEDLKLDRGAFFGSIYSTLNHLMVADLAWLNRFRRHPASFPVLAQLASLPVPTSLDGLLFIDFAAMHTARKQVDAILIKLVEELEDSHLDALLTYKSTNGDRHNKRFSAILQHLFNHQTHHRGQLTTLLTQMGMDFGVTDLVAIVPDEVDG